MCHGSGVGIGVGFRVEADFVSGLGGKQRVAFDPKQTIVTVSDQGRF
jgi:hypothetical protein